MNKIRTLVLIISLLNYCSIKAQFESDIIIMGGGTFDENFNPPVPFKNSIIYFNEQMGIDSIDASKWLNIPIYLNASSSSTWSRDTVMYVTNGYRIVNQRGQIIDPKILSPNFSDGAAGQLAGGQNVIFLSITHEGIEKLYLFYGEYGYKFPAEQSGRLDSLFSYAELNPNQSWPANTALISKNNVLLNSNDTTQNGGISACRHANGRDWWILKPGLRANEFYRFLLSPFGIQMNKYYSNVEPLEVIKGTVYSHFNVLGNKYAYYVPAPGPKRVYLYDFDRCTGELNNPQIHDLTNWLNTFDLNINCLSPDGSKLYIFRQLMNSSQQPGIIQYDFETHQANYLGQDGRIPFVSPNGREVMFLTYIPDSTVLTGFVPHFSIIRNPNESFQNLIIDWNAYNVTNALGLVPPNLAYYRLGAAQGTVCDSLGLSAEAVEDLPVISVFPNPSNRVFYLKVEEEALNQKLLFQMYDMQGRQVFQQNITETTTSFSTFNFQLTQGLYFYQINSNKKGWIKSGKIAVVR